MRKEEIKRMLEGIEMKVSGLVNELKVQEYADKNGLDVSKASDYARAVIEVNRSNGIGSGGRVRGGKNRRGYMPLSNAHINVNDCICCQCVYNKKGNHKYGVSRHGFWKELEREVKENTRLVKKESLSFAIRDFAKKLEMISNAYDRCAAIRGAEECNDEAANDFKQLLKPVHYLIKSLVDDPNALNPIDNVTKETDFETMRRYFANSIAIILKDMRNKKDSRFGEMSKTFFFLRQYSDFPLYDYLTGEPTK